ncbi:MAG TPA: cupin domain-containing protein [Pyrinomonadaceae bacterium]
MERSGFQSLASILQPCSLEEFLSVNWGKTYKHVAGWPSKFSHLLPWNRLNEILQQHRLDFPRLRLTRDGERLRPETYLRYTTGRRKTSVPRLRQAELTRELSLGASLVLDAVDELHGTLTELAEDLELFFRARIQINSYAGWRTSRGFDLHWDDHDVFILQVDGRKRWVVHGPTIPHPLPGDSKEQKPEGPPLWDQILNTGDLLYIPRGFWHVAFPLDEPTLHLTVGVHNRTGLDLARWVTERLHTSETFRQDLPLFASAELRAAYLDQIRSELLDQLDDDLLNRYFQELDANTTARARFSLPWSPTPEVLPESPQTLLRWLAPRPLDLHAKDGIIEFSSQKKRWRFSAAALIILQRLETNRTCSVSELCEAAGPTLPPETVRAFLQELISNGLVAIVSV